MKTKVITPHSTASDIHLCLVCFRQTLTNPLGHLTPVYYTQIQDTFSGQFFSNLQIAQKRERARQPVLCTQERLEPGVAGRPPVATATIGGGNPGRRC